jgi:hypothetical protein
MVGMMMLQASHSLPTVSFPFRPLWPSANKPKALAANEAFHDYITFM